MNAMRSASFRFPKPAALLFALGVLCAGQAAARDWSAVRIGVEHAAVNAARTAAVVIGDDPKRYGGEPVNDLRAGGARAAAVRRSALLTLAAFIADGTLSRVEVLFPPQDSPGGDGTTDRSFNPINMNEAIDKVRVQVKVTARCKIMLANRLACRSNLFSAAGLGLPTRDLMSEAIYPYQGARYTYP